jgi:nicotinamidase-related amidase
MPMHTALLLIDVQRGLIEGFEADWAGVLDTIRAVLIRARAAEVSIVFVQHDGRAGHPLQVGSDGWLIHPSITPLAGEVIVHKRWSDAFAETDLGVQLESLGIRHLVITGAQTEYCVDATVRRAASSGYDVTLVADGHTTSSSRLLSREQIIAHHNRTLPGLAVVGPRIATLPAADLQWPQSTPDMPPMLTSATGAADNPA